ncbi:CDP-glycerol glycerophosphotransferase family protein [Arthrobacter sp. CAU 1506]|uniref:bifunctional glycosyltransferase/CDP-glycerol:glycerophosphate glycerophosphotransferase n=1 Tax=Arthrobacter sp. CAU 1506 TaxID=2560052 RepID=UPI00145F4B6D|nr:CDP-glycerol glycerophosphotransferase family protein [Arthrobacter sp. CAU 1506]
MIMNTLKGRLVKRLDAFRANAKSAKQGSESSASYSNNVAIRRSALRGPILSVVVPVHNVERYIEESLNSIIQQSLIDLEVIVVDDKSTDNSAQIAESLAVRDRRIRVIRLDDNVGPSEARNVGIANAVGKYLGFLDPDDIIARQAYETTISSLESTGSDLAVFGYYRFNSTRQWKAASWIRDLHAETRLKVAAQEHPSVLVNAVVWSKVFRREFWDRAGLHFPVGEKYEDQPVSASAYAKAKSIDILSGAYVGWRQREDGTSITQQIATSADLTERLRAARKSLKILGKQGSASLREDRVAQLVSNDFPHSVAAAVRADEAYWDLLRQGISWLMSQAKPYMWHNIPPQHRVAYELVLRNERNRFIEFFDSGGGNIKNFPSIVESGELLCCLPTFRDAALGIPDSQYALLPRQRQVIPTITRAWWSDVRTMTIHGWAYIDNIDLSHEETTVTCLLVNSATGEEIDLPTHQRLDPETSARSKHKWSNYEASGFSATVKFTNELYRGKFHRSKWQLQVRVETAGFRQQVLLTGIDRHSSAGYLTPSELDNGFRVMPNYVAGGIEFSVHRPSAKLRTYAVDARRVSLTVSSAEAPKIKSFLFVHQPTGFTVECPVDRSDDTVSAILELPRPMTSDGESRAMGSWLVRMVRMSGRRSPIAWQDGEAYGESSSHQGLSAFRTRAGNLGLREWISTVRFESAQFEEDRLVLTVHRGHSEQASVVKLMNDVNPRTNIEANLEQDTVSLSLRTSVWGGASLPLPPGRYRLQLSTDDGDLCQLETSPELLAQLPIVQDSGSLHGRLQRSRNGSLEFVVLRPLRPEERGARQQRELQLWHQQLTPNPRWATALFRSYYGENTACNAKAVHQELMRRNAGVEVYWAVTDHSVEVPDGGIPVIYESREWYELLRNAEYVMDNVHQPIYHEKSPHQKVIQGFHGYPFKEMGHTNWERLSSIFSRARVASFDKRASEWDYLVSPAPYATPLLVQEFRYNGKVLEIGYPRNDSLQQGSASDRRESVREVLGIAPNQTAVLYAPTYRDYLASNELSAPVLELLDMERLVAELGPQYSIMVRGHVSSVRAGSRFGIPEQVIDVTRYPDVADLYLAADVLIADYSSLRFDFGVTGKPMLFFVPDLERYREARDWLLEYEPTAPGPKLTTTEGVIASLRSLDRIEEEYQDSYERFRRDFICLEDGNAAARLVDAVFSSPTPVARDEATVGLSQR